jgi:uncharacterized tellurite resistance protein B-like protein
MGSHKIPSVGLDGWKKLHNHDVLYIREWFCYETIWYMEQTSDMIAKMDHQQRPKFCWMSRVCAKNMIFIVGPL